ncbi:MAG: hypothetical protein H7230_02885 [Candidatus Parcubacteria bacterium]|nr:hypothetical protein [Candidatus Paceibacterota bacterium]
MREATEERGVTLESINYNLSLIGIMLKRNPENIQGADNHSELTNSLDKLRQFKRGKAVEFYICTAASIIAVVGGISLSETGYNTFIGDALIPVGVAIGLVSFGNVARESKVYDDELQTLDNRANYLLKDVKPRDLGPAGTE